METLQGKSLSEVEALFRDAPLAPPPKGRFQGTLLHWLEGPPARHRLWRPALALMFQFTPFGVDFDARRWFLLHHRLRLGHFEAVPRRSRWREADVYGLEYEVSRLPGHLKALLYDELKPLSPDVCLGIGGMVLQGDPQPAFFFSLERQL